MATVPINADSSPGVVLELLYSIKVKDAMTRDVMTASPTSKLRDVQTLMRDNAITGIPILEEGRLLGIVSIGDIISALDSGTMDRSANAVMSGSVITLDEEMPLSFAVTYFDRYKFGRVPSSIVGKLSGILTSSISSAVSYRA